MKKFVAILMLVITLSVVVSSCTSSRSSRGGCYATKSMIGYR